MVDREKVIRGLECCKSMYDWSNGLPWKNCPYSNEKECGDCGINQMFDDALSLLKEQEKLVDVDALREKLGLAKDCAKCKQNTRACQYDSHFSLMDFCERLDMAIDELK